MTSANLSELHFFFNSWTDFILTAVTSPTPTARRSFLGKLRVLLDEHGALRIWGSVLRRCTKSARLFVYKSYGLETQERTDSRRSWSIEEKLGNTGKFRINNRIPYEIIVLCYMISYTAMILMREIEKLIWKRERWREKRKILAEPY